MAAERPNASQKAHNKGTTLQCWRPVQLYSCCSVHDAHSLPWRLWDTSLTMPSRQDATQVYNVSVKGHAPPQNR
eukprot:5301804-Amphidinium_carterae.1